MLSSVWLVTVRIGVCGPPKLISFSVRPLGGPNTPPEVRYDWILEKLGVIYTYMLSFDHNKFLRSPSRSLIQWSFRKVHCFSWDWFVNNSRGLLFCIISELQGIAMKYQRNSAYSQHLPNKSKTKRSDWEWSLWVRIICGVRYTPSISRWNTPLIPSPLIPALSFRDIQATCHFLFSDFGHGGKLVKPPGGSCYGLPRSMGSFGTRDWSAGEQC